MRTLFQKKNTSLLLGIGLFAIIVLLGLLAPWLAPHNPLQVNLPNRLLSPSGEYPFGTDHLGRCILSRILYGIRTTVTIAFVILGLSLCISLPIGLLTGYFGGRTDHFFMRLMDGTLAFPDFVLTIAIVGILGPGFTNMIIAIVIVRWANYVRLIRGLVLKVSKEDYLITARMSGNTHLRIMRRYILPQIAAPIAVFSTLDIGKIVLLIAGLSFLGLGVQPPTPEWGVMLHDATRYFQLAPHVMIFPGLAIVSFVLSCQLIGDRFKEQNADVPKEV
ncbi:nickel ABC transporter permease subunit NikC [Paenibacillus sp. BIHB 4019]|uniref:Nickel ABC transporter permease subunit NikC n=1 Tax=Paenibacillus sp. BIHB 4019 TaxID=1870819 RepID=A0A1B2DRM7_9BACL|nr:nickel transporter permease [Paenibacillus sp. BIHB 4019]ANY70355.1 nickel ABC transporter permease subunit NikC [Paenibacillus sp. BIHB 4019]